MIPRVHTFVWLKKRFCWKRMRCGCTCYSWYGGLCISHCADRRRRSCRCGHCGINSRRMWRHRQITNWVAAYCRNRRMLTTRWMRRCWRRCKKCRLIICNRVMSTGNCRMCCVPWYFINSVNSSSSCSRVRINCWGRLSYVAARHHGDWWCTSHRRRWHWRTVEINFNTLKLENNILQYISYLSHNPVFAE